MKKLTNPGGRRQPSIFLDKSTYRVQGVLTKPGSERFEAARARLTRLAKWPRPASDGDTIEYLARGHYATKQYLKERAA